MTNTGFGVWLAARRLNEGGFNWPRPGQKHIELTDEQLQALVLGLPWHIMSRWPCSKNKHSRIKTKPLKRWTALTRYLDDGCVPIDNNHIEQQIRPLALGRKNWLFAGSLRAGQRAAAVMTLIQSTKLNGHDPLAYLGDILQRLPTQPNHRIHELLPHHWQPAQQ